MREHVKGAGSDRAVCGGGGGVDEEGVEPEVAEEGLRRVAIGGEVIKCPSPLNVLKDAYDRSCY